MERDARTRVAAVDAMRAEAGTDKSAIAAAAEKRKAIAWNRKESDAVRLGAITSLVNDPDADVAADAREMGRLMLPQESSRAVVTYWCAAAVDRGWDDYVPAIVRSYSRLLTPPEPDTDRVEHKALVRIAKGRPIEDMVFDTFLNPPQRAPSYGMDWTQRYRASAWDLLARLDKTGEVRTRLLAAAPPGGTGSDEVIAQIRRAANDLRAIPLTGDELTWLASLLDPKKEANATWWAEASSAIARVRERGPFQLRHAEVIRLTSRLDASRLERSREELLGELSARLKGRSRAGRTIDTGVGRLKDDISENRDRLSWADCLTVLLLDDMIRSPEISAAIFAQVAMDRKDTTTEYGGVMAWRDTPRGPQGLGVPAAVLFPPRPGQRQGDTKFIASDDMIRASDRGLAHYHFHVASVRNSEYAGPSMADFAYAARSGRNCIVVTSLSDTELNVDYYQPDGLTLDLGTISAPGKGR